MLADNAATLQVEAPHGKRSKVKGAPSCCGSATRGRRFHRARSARRRRSTSISCGSARRGGVRLRRSLAREYFGREPSPAEAAGVLLKLHGAPMYFYARARDGTRPRRTKRSRPRSRASRGSASRRAERAMRRRLSAGAARGVPAAPPATPSTSPTGTGRMESAGGGGTSLKLAPARLIERCGGLASTHDYHLNRFLFEHFPRGAGFPDVPAPEVPADLPLADVAAFSIDDASTTEIDDAFSVTRRSDGNVRVGIHIAAPALGRARVRARCGRARAPVDRLLPRRQDHDAAAGRDRPVHARRRTPPGAVAVREVDPATSRSGRPRRASSACASPRTCGTTSSTPQRDARRGARRPDVTAPAARAPPAARCRAGGRARQERGAAKSARSTPSTWTMTA